MRYLRMLSNSLAGGVLGAAYLTVLVLQLNPHIPLEPQAIGPLWFRLSLFYGIHLAAVFYTLVVFRQLLATEMLSPGWLSVRVLSVLWAVCAATAAALMWANLRAFGATIDPASGWAMMLGAATLLLTAVVFLMIGVARRNLGRRRRAVGAVLLVITAAGSVGGTLALRGAGRDPSPGPMQAAWRATVEPASLPRVTMILLDGASLDYISPAAAEGRLANFGKILDAGASMHLATIRPTQPGPVWAAAATGKYPSRNGVRSGALYEVPGSSWQVELLPEYCFLPGLVRLGLMTEVRRTVESWRAKPLWNVLNGWGLSVGVVGWPLTYPAPPVHGYLVSDRFHEVAGTALAADEGAVYPSEIALTERGVWDPEGGEPLTLRVGFGSPFERGREENPASAPSARDLFYARVATELRHRYDVRVAAVRYQGLDAVGHRYLRYATPRAFGDVSVEERERYGNVLERYYGFIDAQLGFAMEELGPSDLLLVISGFGLEPVSVGRRVLSRALGYPEFTGTHDQGPDGFMLGFGAAVTHARLPLGAIVDVAPTVLYFLGLPVARDMDGYARGDMFTDEFAAERPITFIPTYDR